MKLLFDANLSRRIVPPLTDLLPDSAHVSQVRLGGQTPDAAIREIAGRNGFVIVTADSDFVRLADLHGIPPRVVRLERMDYSTELAAELIRKYAIAVTEFGEEPAGCPDPAPQLSRHARGLS